MKFAWKIFFSACTLLILSLGAGSFLLVNASFRNTLESRRAAALEKADSQCLSYQALLAADQLLSTNLAPTSGGLSDQQPTVTEENPFPQSLSQGQRGSRLFANSSGQIIFQIVYALESPDGQVLYMEIQEDFSDIYQLRQRSQLLACAVVAGVCLVSGIVLFWFSRRLTRPLDRLAKTAVLLGEGDLTRRAPSGGSTQEIALLSKSFNRMADQVEQQMEQLREESRRRDEFVANFTHELKTPLTSIIGYADLMRSFELEAPQRREYSDFIFREGSRLESLSPLSPINSRILLEGARRSLAPLLEKEKIELLVRLEDHPVLANADLVQTLVYNLADNARKAMDGPVRKVLITGRLTEDRYQITVSDTGRGIPADQLARITEPFYMVDKSRSRRQGGAGLGLALCQRIAQLHGSRLDFISQPGTGTSVTFTLPRAPAAGADKEEQP